MCLRVAECHSQFCHSQAHARCTAPLSLSLSLSHSLFLSLCLSLPRPFASIAPFRMHTHCRSRGPESTNSSRNCCVRNPRTHNNSPFLLLLTSRTAPQSLLSARRFLARFASLRAFLASLRCLRSSRMRSMCCSAVMSPATHSQMSVPEYL